MAKATVLVVDRDQTRRREVVRELAALGCEAVAAASAEEGRRFAAGVSADVIVAEAELVPGEDVAPGHPIRIVLGSGTSAGGPGGVTVVSAGLAAAAVVNRVRTALVGRELGVAAEPDLAALCGDLRACPVLELVPRLHAARVSARVVVGDGEIALADGEVTGCRAGAARGVKAFARLARTTSGGFRIVLGAGSGAREIRTDMLTLMAGAMEDGPRFDDAAGRLPDLASRIRLVIGPAFFAAQFSALQRQLLTAAPDGESVWDAVDCIPEPDGVVLEEIARLGELGFVAFEPPEVKVRVVTDSAADLPAALAERFDVLVVPATVLVGGESFKDGVELTSSAFFNRVAGRHRAAETKPPTAAEFLAAYRTVVPRKDVVSVHPSARLSEAFSHAGAAAEEGSEDFRRVRGRGTPAIEVVDSGLVSTPLALLVMVAAVLAERRLPASEIRSRLEAMKARFHVFFALDHPDYIARGASANGLSMFLGSMLGVRQVLGVRDGEIAAVERVRGEGNVPARLVELLKERVDPGRPVLAGIGHSGAPQAAVRLRSLLHQELKVAELLENEIGPAVGLHVGPGCVGAAVFQPTQEELELIHAA